MDNFYFSPLEAGISLLAFCVSGFMVAGFLGFARYILFSFMESKSSRGEGR